MTPSQRRIPSSLKHPTTDTMSDLDILHADYHEELPTTTIDTNNPPPHPSLRPLALYTPERHAFLTIVDTRHDALSCAEAEICENIDSLRNTLNALFEEQKGVHKIDQNLKAACETKFEALEASFGGAFRQMMKFETERVSECRRAVLWELEKVVEEEHRMVWVRIQEMADLVSQVMRTREGAGDGDDVRVGTGDEE